MYDIERTEKWIGISYICRISAKVYCYSFVRVFDVKDGRVKAAEILTALGFFLEHDN